MNLEKVVVTTTPSMEGWSILEYVGVVSSRVVAGTGVFSDFVAGFSDFFGGRSGTYQRQLQSINEDALKALRFEVAQLGCNAVLSVRIDHDEISGKNVQMFMVTASGTAVKARKTGPSIAEAAVGTAFLTPEAVGAAVEVNALRERIKYDAVKFDDETWELAIRNKVVELAPLALRELGNPKFDFARSSEEQQSFRERFLTLFSAIPEESAKEHLYSDLTQSQGTGQCAIDTIQALNLFDLERVKRVASEGHPKGRERALQVVTANCSSYGRTQISELRQAVDFVKNKYPVVRQTKTKTQRLTGKEKQVFVCPCGVELYALDARCANCRTDQYGIGPKLTNPAQAAQILETRLAVLCEHFGVTDESD